MAAGPWVFYDSAKMKLLSGDLDFDGHTFMVIPVSDAYTPDFSTDDALADITAHEVSDGSSSMRETLVNVSLTAATGAQVIWDADDVVMTSTNPVDIKYAVIVDDTDPTDALICCCDLETTVGTGLRITQLTIQLPNGIFRIA